MQATVTTTITIAATPNKVFDYIADLKYHYLWNPQIISIKPIQRLELGAKYTTESRVLGTPVQAMNEVTSFKPSKELSLENAFGTIQYTATFQLTPLDKKTQVRLSTRLSTDKKIYIFSKPVLKQLALRELRTDLQALKIAIENDLN